MTQTTPRTVDRLQRPEAGCRQLVTGSRQQTMLLAKSCRDPAASSRSDAANALARCGQSAPRWRLDFASSISKRGASTACTYLAHLRRFGRWLGERYQEPLVRVWLSELFGSRALSMRRARGRLGLLGGDRSYRKAVTMLLTGLLFRQCAGSLLTASGQPSLTCSARACCTLPDCADSAHRECLRTKIALEVTPAAVNSEGPGVLAMGHWPAHGCRVDLCLVRCRGPDATRCCCWGYATVSHSGSQAHTADGVRMTIASW